MSAHSAPVATLGALLASSTSAVALARAVRGSAFAGTAWEVRSNADTVRFRSVIGCAGSFERWGRTLPAVSPCHPCAAGLGGCAVQSSETATAQQDVQSRKCALGGSSWGPLPRREFCLASARHVIRSTTKRHGRPPHRPSYHCNRFRHGKKDTHPSWEGAEPEGRSGVGCQARPATHWYSSPGPTNRARRGAVLAGWGGVPFQGGGGEGFFLLRVPPGRGAVGHLPAGFLAWAVGCGAGGRSRGAGTGADVWGGRPVTAPLQP